MLFILGLFYLGEKVLPWLNLTAVKAVYFPQADVLTPVVACLEGALVITVKKERWVREGHHMPLSFQDLERYASPHHM